MDGPRDERDFKAELEIRTPAWLPGIRVATSFQRLWDKRGADYANRTAEFAGIDTDELEHQLNQGGPIADLFLEGGRRVVEDGDEVLCDAVTRLVAAALRDNALIHDASYLMKKLSTCETLHIRAICAIPHPEPPPPEKPSASDYRSRVRDGPRGSHSEYIQWQFEQESIHMKNMEEWEQNFSIDSIAETCRASKSLVRAALGELDSSGFVEKRQDGYGLTELGADFRDLILKIDATEKNL